MRSGSSAIFWLALTATGLAGCALSEHSPKLQPVPSRQVSAPQQASGAARPRAQTVPQEAANTPHGPAPGAASDARQASSANAPSTALVEAVQELKLLESLDPEAHQRLLADLERVDPALWPQMIATLKVSAAYKQRQAERASQPDSDHAGSEHETAPRLGQKKPPADEPEPQPATLELDAAEVAAAFASDGDPPPAMPDESDLEQPAQTAEVRPASFERAAEVPQSIEQRLSKLIHDLDGQNMADASPAERDRHEVALRLLSLIADRREEALRPISGMEPARQEFWTKQLYGLGALLGAREPDDAAGHAEAALYLAEATTRLRDSAMLVVRSLAFCTEVNSYGVYKPFDRYVFQPGQEVLLYAEIENFKSELGADGYRTTLHSRYEIFDRQGQQVEQRDFGVTEEVCRNRRRDFFIRYQFSLPQRLYDGGYTLKLTVEDDLATKIGQSAIDFTIKESDR